MLFSSLTFLYYFLPAVLIIYLVTPRRFRNVALLFSSLFFYAWGEPAYVLLMCAVIIGGYVFGLLIEKYRKSPCGRAVTACGILGGVFLLGYFKYADFFVGSIAKVSGMPLKLPGIALPIGISFYIFQMLSYLIDVNRGEGAQRNFISLATYISMFPQLIAGPIVRYSHIEKQLAHRTVSLDMAAWGISRFVTGLGKKVIIANTLGELTEQCLSTSQPSLLSGWLYGIAVALQIFFDFSGYSDMAIGLGKIFGFHFPENFDYPFISKSVTEFWRRWHMSLGSWFRDYLYIPLGGNRVPFYRYVLNCLVVWAATGLWHGAAWNFVVWGLYFAVLIILEKKWLGEILKRSRFFSRIYLLFVVVISFVIFHGDSLGRAWEQIGMMFGIGVPPVSEEGLFFLRNYGGILVIAIIGSTPLVRNMIARSKKYRTGEKVIHFFEPIYLMTVFFIVTAFLVNSSYNPFLYFRF